MVKFTACGRKPLNYFRDSWNCLDSFIVFMTYLLMSNNPAFKNFPMVLLRIMRLMRVFRLARVIGRAVESYPRQGKRESR